MPNEYVSEFEGKPLYRATLSDTEIYGEVVAKKIAEQAAEIERYKKEIIRLQCDVYNLNKAIAKIKTGN